MVLAGSVMLLPTSTAAASLTGRQLASPSRIGAAPRLPKGAKALDPLLLTTKLHVEVVLQPRDPVALARFANAVSTPGSRLYRHYLARDQFPEVFGPTRTEVAEVEGVLRADGLQPGVLSADRLSIPVTATAEHLGRAFSTNFRRYKMQSGRIAFANTSAPLFPGDVVRLVQGVIGLDDLYLPHSLGLVAEPAHSAPGFGPLVGTGGPQPCTAAAEAGGYYSSYTANQLASAYRFSSLYGAGDEGAGISVALFELEPNLSSDISAYQSCYGTSANVTYTEIDSGPGTGAGSGEAALDIEDVIGLAPKVNIDVYQGPNDGTGPYDTYSAIVSADRAQVISTSWGVCEPDASSFVAAEDVLFEQAASQGQSLFAAAGDSGSEDCSGGSGPASLAVDDPASQPFVTGVGGTTLSSLGPPPTESVWDDPSTGAGGGGISASWTMPSYQADAASSLHVINSNSSGDPCAAGAGLYCREVPDVSADADPFTGYVIYYAGLWIGTGGTSAAAPLWAALTALVDASSSCASTPIGFANPALYTVAGSSSFSSAFQDVTDGNNDFEGSNLGLYPAGTGYDMATGLGTPDASALAPLLCTSAAPSVSTAAATDVSTTSASLQGTVNSNRTATTYYFEYGTTLLTDRPPPR